MNALIERQGVVYEKIDLVNGWELDSVLERAMDALRCPPPEQVVDVLSGGERRRVALCRLLLQKPDILLLDEPTNHLDAETVAWLERHLQQYEGTIIAITHDRYFLDNVAGWILELDRGEGIPFKGNYSSWLEQKERRLAQEEKHESDRQKALKRELEWINMGVKGRQAKHKEHITKYEQLLAQDGKGQIKDTKITIPAGPRLGGVVVEAQQLTKGYGDKLLFENLDFTIPPGAVVGIVGPNGAGKTTTMCMLLGLTEPTEGSIKLFGLDARDGKNRKEIYTKIGSIIETPGFYPQLNAHENLKIFSKLRGDYNPENIEKVLKLVNLSDEKKPFRNYSLGMKQRLGLAAALVHEPELLILDEPINGLDPAGIVEIRDMLLDITSKLGITVLISSHILSEIELLADEIGIISQGKLIKELTKEELGEQSTKSVIIEVDNIGLAEDMMIKNGYVKDSDFKVDNNEIILLTDIDSRSKINESFVKNGIQVNELHLKEENLEEYFMRLINEGI